MKKNFVTVTQLHEKNNKEIIEYFESIKADFNALVRKTYHEVKNDPENFNQDEKIKEIQANYTLLRRTSENIVKSAVGRYNNLKELKKYEKEQRELKLEKLTTEILPKLEERLKRENQRLQENPQTVNLFAHRNLRLKIVAKKSQINKLKQQINNLDYQIETGKLKHCFGSKKLLKNNYYAFTEQRDSQIMIIGDKYKKANNQLFQLEYNSKNNQYTIKMRKDIGGFKYAEGEDRYVYGKVYFNYQNNLIKRALVEKNTPLTYQIIKKNNRYYLYCTFEIQVDKEEFNISKSNGTIGLDLNKGFIALAETNYYGDLVDTQIYKYRFYKGNKTKTDLEQIIKKIVDKCKESNKPLIVEYLDFRRKRGKLVAKHKTQYNHMITGFPHTLFREMLEGITYRNKVRLEFVNPAYTSIIGKQKYANKMKLNSHTAAAYVIARKGQGYKDTVQK